MEIYNDIDVKLQQQVEHWLAMPVESKDSQKQADNYYQEYILPLLIHRFSQKEGGIIREQEIFGLIMTVGTSPEPLILSISACRPQRVFFLYTEETEAYLDEIVKATGLGISRLDKQQVPGTDPVSIYQAVLQTWDRWGRPANVAADITGGTKSMTGGLAIAGAVLGFTLLYVATNRYLRERRRPFPGSEYLEVLPNPYAVFGVLEEERVRALFRLRDYRGASSALSELVEKVPQPRRFQVLYYLSRAYEEWEGLNLHEAAKNLQVVSKHWEALDPRAVPGWPESQAQRLQHLANLMPTRPGEPVLGLLQDAKATETLVITIYLNAKRMAERGKYDSASLYLYRLLEAMEQRRLAVSGLDTSAPNYNGNFESGRKQALLQEVNHIRKACKLESLEQLPIPISLADGYILLEALEDAFRLSQTRPKPIHWRQFMNNNQKRNHSILAHGFIFVPQEQYEDYKDMAERLLELFCQVEGIDLDDAVQKHGFSLDPFAELPC